MKIGVVGVVIGVLVLLTGWAFVDPQAQIPVVAPVVCSLKGADWYSETPLNLLPPGCYARSDELTTPTTSAPAEVVGDEDLTTTTLLPTTTTRPPDSTREERAVRRADEAYRRLQDEYDRAVDRNDAAAQERILDAQERALDDQNAATQALTDCQSGP